MNEQLPGSFGFAETSPGHAAYPNGSKGFCPFDREDACIFKTCCKKYKKGKRCKKCPKA